MTLEYNHRASPAQHHKVHLWSEKVTETVAGHLLSREVLVTPYPTQELHHIAGKTAC